MGALRELADKLEVMAAQEREKGSDQNLEHSKRLTALAKSIAYTEVVSMIYTELTKELIAQ